MRIRFNPDRRLRELERAVAAGDQSAMVALDRHLARTGKRSAHYAEQLLLKLIENAREYPAPADGVWVDREGQQINLVGESLAGAPGGPVLLGPEHYAWMHIPGPFERPQGFKLSILVENSLISYTRAAINLGAHAGGLRETAPATSIRVMVAFPPPRKGDPPINPIYWFWRNSRRWSLSVEERFARKVPTVAESWHANLHDFVTWERAVAAVASLLDDCFHTIMQNRIDAVARQINHAERRLGAPLTVEGAFEYVQSLPAQSLPQTVFPLQAVPGPVIGRNSPGPVKPHVKAWNASGDGMCEGALTALADYLVHGHRAVIQELRADAYNQESGYFNRGYLSVTSRRARRTNNPLRIMLDWDRMNGAWADRGEAWIGNEIPPGGLWRISMVRTPSTAAELVDPIEAWVAAEFPDAGVEVAFNYEPGSYDRPDYRPSRRFARLVGR